MKHQTSAYEEGYYDALKHIHNERHLESLRAMVTTMRKSGGDIGKYNEGIEAVLKRYPKAVPDRWFWKCLNPITLIVAFYFILLLIYKVVT